MPPGATARSVWTDVPGPLLDAVQRAVASRVVGVEAVADGRASRPSAGLSLADGRQVHARAAAVSQDPGGHALLEREADVLRLLPATVPHAPLVARVVHDDWLAVVTSGAPGSAPGPPWRSGGVVAAAEAVRATAAHAAPASLGSVTERMPDLDAWAHLLSEAPHLLGAPERARAASLVAMGDGWRVWTAGERLVHLDVRCGTVSGTGEDAVLVGWGHAGAGASWLDEALLVVDVVASGHAGGPRTAVDAAVGLLAHLPYEATRLVVASIGASRRAALLGVGATDSGAADRAARLAPLLERLVSR